MSNTATCPTPDQLDDLLANRLSAAEAEAIRRHLGTCPVCQGGRASAPSPTGKPSEYPFLEPPRGPGELGWLDGHRVLGLLGEGGMSFVFDAEDTQLGRRVALKVLRPRMADPVQRERFLREARLIAGLPHDHIVTVFRVGEANGVPYLSMERLEGVSMQARLDRDKWLPLAEALSLSREAAEGLVVAHDAGLVHRDIKPANIWLEMRQGRFRRVKIIDFGIAKMVHQEVGLTMTGQLLGTPMYMAPEQASGKPVDGRTDLYGLGCVMFQMLTGEPPRAGHEATTLAVLQALKLGEVPKVKLAAPQLPGPVAELVQEMLSADPDGRPENARAVVARLRHLEQTICGDVVPPPPQAAAAAKRGLIRRPGLLGILLGIFTITTALLVSAFTMVYKVTHREKPWKVGILHSYSEALSLHETHIARATKFAIDEINDERGIAGRPIKYFEEDGESNDDTFELKARKLIDEDGVDVLFGCWSSSSRKRVEKVCQEKGKLLFYPAISEGLEESPNVVYLGGVPNQTMVPMVDWATARLKKARFFLVSSEGDYSRIINFILKHEITKRGAEVTDEVYADGSSPDCEKYVEQIKATKSDIVISTLDGLANHALLGALRRGGVTPDKVPTIWVSLSETELPVFGRGQIVGDYSVACYFECLPPKSNRDFLERYREWEGKNGRVNDAMQTAYFGVRMWKRAIEMAGGSDDLSKLREALSGLSVDAPEGKVELDKKTQHAYRQSLVGKIIKNKNDRIDFDIVYNSSGPLAPEPFPSWQPQAKWIELLNALPRK